MPGDYTRFTFDAHSDYAGVFKQQGRVDLDADFNELVELIDRRWRAETIDVIGHGTVPRVPPATPPALDPFLVTPTALGDFEIGIGRMYVDGILVENHGIEPFSYRADLGELRGTVAPLYSDQPYLPAPLPPALPGTAGTSDLIYVDVWQRELTALEDPSLREIALGGPDTTTRMQNVWQVRALQDVGAHGCGDDIADWNELIAPSAGRLTVTAVAPPAADDPCILSPSGGYRGLENRLYRVEIHATGTIGGGAPARFKWSRDNANVAASVTAIASTTQITVQQLGRDPTLKFAIGNWIEITDDFRELQGLSGHMAQIALVDEANRTLTFAPAIAGMTFDATDPERHTRVRRWDSNGLIDVVPGPINLEQGVRVEFTLDPAGGAFHIGDYWAFAARTADGSVEELDHAPPRGILHHYCRLGFVHWGATLAATTFTDCRVRWPPLGDCGCCTVTVGDGVDSFGDFTDIQQAIDALGNRGGVVCIGRGFYRVTRGLVINNTKRNVIVRGMGPATRIVFAPEAGTTRVFLEVRDTEQVRVEDLFVASGDADALVRFNQSRFCRVEDCALVNLQPRDDDDAPAPRAVEFTEECSHCVISRCVLLAGKAVSTAQGELREFQLRDSLVLAQRMAVFITQGNGVEIVHNQIRGLPRGALPGSAALTRATIDAFQQQVWAQVLAAPSFANFPAAGIFMFSAQRVIITQNLISAQLAVAGFLLINTRIQHNDIVSLIGVLLVLALRVKVDDNFVFALFAGLAHGGILFDLDVTSNEILGLNGILFMSAGEMVVALLVLLAAALGAGGLGGASGSLSFSAAMKTHGSLLAGLNAVGFVLFTKIHRNVFLSFTRGIYKSDSVVSLDLSIVDNTFTLCRTAAIELGTGPNPGLIAALRSSLSLRHLIQGNAITVTGKGVVSSTAFTEVADNDIQSRLTGIEFDAAECSARDNFVLNTVEGVGPEDQALVLLHGACWQARVCGNRLMNSSRHAILIRENVVDLTIEDNEIELARGFGIGTFSGTVQVSGGRIARNRIHGCGSLPHANAVAAVVSLGRCENLRIVDNVISENRPIGAQGQFPFWYVVYCSEARGLEFAGNSIFDNLPGADIAGRFSALHVEEPLGVIRIQDNVVRGNGGAVVEMMPLFFLFTPLAERPQVLIQNNHFAAGARRTVWFMQVYNFQTLLLQGNRCIEETANAFSTTPIYVFGERANVNGNVATLAAQTAVSIMANSLLVNANTVDSGPRALEVHGAPTGASTGATRTIVTSNLTSGLIASSTGTLVQFHNIPGP